MEPVAEERLLLAQVAAVCRAVHGTDAPALTLDSDLKADAGLDSLALAEVTDRIAEAFGVDVDPDAVAGAASPRDLLRAVRRSAARQSLSRDAPRASVPAGPSTGTPPPKHGREPSRAARGGHPSSPLLWPSEVATLNEALERHAADHGAEPIIHLLDERRNAPVQEITYGSLLDDARAAARGLLTAGVDVGDRVALMLPTGREYFTMFWGVLLAGGVPVPLYPPARLATVRAHLEVQRRTLVNAGATMLVTIPQVSAVARLVQARVPSLASIRTPQTLARSPGRGPLPTATGSDLALIQYTSGSTGDPKGVVLTQAQLLANMSAMAEAASVTQEDTVVTWLPLYHDMGLIGLWLTPVVLGLRTTVLSPLAFLARPASWLEALTAYGGTLSAAPNFAYQACADRVTDAERSALDLSRWRIAFNGSEQVSPAAIEAFVARFEPVGFARGTMCPAYGLAEAGVGVSFSPPGRGPRIDTISRRELASSGRAVEADPAALDAQEIVGCGFPLPGYEVRVTGRGGIELPDRTEGRVECRGPSASSGYYANDAATHALWRHGWLDTGDLGYVSSGELFLTGRRKDLVIRGGRNLHPEELEELVGRLPGLQAGHVAVFASTDPRRGTERMVVAVETTAASPEERRHVEDQVRRCIVGSTELPPEVVTLVPPGSIQRTPSGKIRREATRQAFETGTLGGRPAPVPLQLVQLAARDVVPATRRAAHLAGAWSFALGAWLLVAAVGTVAWCAVRLPVSRTARWRLVRRCGQTLSVLIGIPVQVEGRWPSPTGPQVVVANHASFVDGLALMLASPRPLTFVTSTDLGRLPVAGSFLRRLGCRFVTRDDPAKAPGDVASLVEAARQGETLAFFPEGSLAPVRGIRPFHLGAFAVAAATDATLVPVGIRGTSQVVRPGAYLPRRATVQVVVGDPVPAPHASLDDEAAVADTLRRSLGHLTGEPRTGAGR